jgi:hypothetical protein
MNAGDEYSVHSLVFIIVSVDWFSNPIYPSFCRSHDVNKSLNSSVMEYEQRVVIKFLTNESVDAHEIHTRLSAQPGEQT